MSQFNNLSNEQLVSLIEEYKAEGNAAIKKICVVLKEMHNRKVRHPFHKDLVFKWFREIADGKLLPGIVSMFNGNKRYLQHVVGRPLDVQNAIIALREFGVVYARAGEVVESRQHAKTMALGTFQRLFPIGESPRTVSQQRAILEAELAAKPKTHIRAAPIVKADAEKKTLTVGRQSVPLNAIRAALREIGYDVVQRVDLDILP